MTLPIIEHLAAMTDDADRADWLLRCPFGYLIMHQAEIAAVLDAAGFAEGVKALETELMLMNATRLADGGFRQEPLFAAHIARSDLRMIIKRGTACGK